MICHENADSANSAPTPCNAAAIVWARTLLGPINALLRDHLLLSHDDRFS